MTYMMILGKFSVWSHQRRTILPKHDALKELWPSQQTTHMCKPYLDIWIIRFVDVHCIMFGKHPAPRTKIGLLITPQVLNLTVICLGKGNGAFRQSSLSLEFFWQSPTVRFFQPSQHASTAATRFRKYVQPYFNQVLPQVATMLLQFRVQFVRGSMGLGCDLYSIYNDTMMIAWQHVLVWQVCCMLLVTYM